MGLDIRLPLGLMFALIGAVLTIFGLVAPERSQALGLNANLIWGGCIFVFGAVMLAAWKVTSRGA
jgi:hypothetical protein